MKKKNIIMFVLLFFFGFNIKVVNGKVYDALLCRYENTVKFSDKDTSDNLVYWLHYQYDSDAGTSSFLFKANYLTKKKEKKIIEYNLGKNLEDAKSKGYYDNGWGKGVTCLDRVNNCISIFQNLEDFECPKNMAASLVEYGYHGIESDTTFVGPDLKWRAGDKPTFISFSNSDISGQFDKNSYGSKITVSLKSTKKAYDAKVEGVTSILETTLTDYKNKASKDKLCKNELNLDTLPEEFGNAFKSNLSQFMFGDDLTKTGWSFPGPFYGDGLANYIEKFSEYINKTLNECISEAKTDDEKKALEEAQEEFGNAVRSYEVYDSWDPGFNWDGPENCTGFFGDPKDSIGRPPAWYLQILFKIIKYLAVILTVVLSSMDFIKAITSQDKEALNKAIQKSAKRLILVVAVFLLPMIINFVLKLIGAYGTCGIE